ncbi:MAG TPA: amidohydrolase family protein [Nakamurella sp.]|nr:amidohydrolase family protein [Nakamurella sp.]
MGAEVGTADDMRSAVREHVEHGVDVIKIMASGGNLTPGSRPELAQFDPEILRVAVDETHRAGLTITAHAHGTPAVAGALLAGVDQLEHVTFMTADGVDPAPPDLVATIVERRVNLSLTVGFVPTVDAPPNPMTARLPALLANLRWLCSSGAPITAGTDAGVTPGKPHDAARWAV